MSTEHYVTVVLSEGLRTWFAGEAAAHGKTVSEEVQIAVEAYADSMRIQHRQDDVAYDRMGTPRKDRMY